MNELLVSVLVITYNQEKFIGQALESILRQETNFEFEIVIGEDCSTDRTAEIIKCYENKHKDKIRCFFRKKNLGAERNYANLLFSHAHGKYIACCEGDDYWCGEDRLQKQIDFLEQNSQYIGMASNVNNVNKYGVVLRENAVSGMFPYKHTHIYTLNDALRGEQLGQDGGIVYRNFFQSMSKKEAVLYRKCIMNGDIKTCVTAAMHGDIFYSSDITANYRCIRQGECNWNSRIRDKNMNGFYYDAFLSLQRYIYKAYHKQMSIDDKLMNCAFESFVIFMDQPSLQNLKIFFHIMRDGYFSKTYIIKEILRRIVEDYKIKRKSIEKI